MGCVSMRAGGGDGRIGERREQRSRGGERPGGGRGGSSSCKQAGAKELSARQFEVPELPETAIKNPSCLKQPSKLSSYSK